MESIKEAFSNVKEDILFLKEEINSLKKELNETRKVTIDALEIIKKKEYLEERKNNNPTDRQTDKTNNYEFPTNNTLFRALKPQNLGISTGNQGVPTDRQTNRQTNRQTYIQEKNKNLFKEDYGKTNSIDQAAEMLDSLDNIKKEIRIKFKRLTSKEFLVFSTIYKIIQEKGECDYKSLAKEINLSQSSIRDYVGRLIKKQIPIEKYKLNNKDIRLSISSNLTKIAKLSTIMKLRSI